MAFGERRGDRRVGEVEVVVPDEDVDAGRVAAADLHAVDRRERLLDRQVPGEGRPPGIPAGEIGDGCAGAEAVAPQRPEHVAQGDRRGVRCLQLIGVQRGRQRLVELGGVGVELIQPRRDPGDEPVVAVQGEQTGYAVHGCIDAGERGGDRGDVAASGEGGVEAGRAAPRRSVPAWSGDG